MRTLLNDLILTILVAVGCSDVESEVRTIIDNSPDLMLKELLTGKWINVESDSRDIFTNDRYVLTLNSDLTGFQTIPADSFRIWIKHDMPVSWLVEQGDLFVTVDQKNPFRTVTEHVVRSIDDSSMISDVTRYDYKADVVVNTDVTKRILYKRVTVDYSQDILGVWKGRCITADSPYYDNRDHLWEYKDNGVFTHAVSDGRRWLPTYGYWNHYFVEGPLLCTRWFVDEVFERREWWEIEINDDTMTWNALRTDDSNPDGVYSTFVFTRIR